jgi:hypothetical protein
VSGQTVAGMNWDVACTFESYPPIRTLIDYCLPRYLLFSAELPFGFPRIVAPRTGRNLLATDAHGKSRRITSKSVVHPYWREDR